MIAPLEKRRIIIYLTFAFGIAWTTALVIYLTGGLQNSPEVVAGSGIRWALILLAGPVMWSPALAHLFTRWITGEGWQNTYLRPKFRRGWPYWLAAWFMPGCLTIGGLFVFFLLFPQYYDPTLGALREMLAASSAASSIGGIDLSSINVWTIAAVQVAQALLIAPLVNGLFTFGEEFGWRAYLQPKLLPLGGR